MTGAAPNRRRFLILSALFGVTSEAAEPDEPVWRPRLEKIRAKHDLPGLGAAIVTTEGCESRAATGVRKKGTETAVTPVDCWHLGSNTKAMTATLAAVAVAEGKLRWDSRLGEVFPAHPELKQSPLAEATLTQLLTHWSGLPPNAKWAAHIGDDVRIQRAKVLTAAAQTRFRPKPGEKHEYSNFGYVVAGHMLEQIWDAPWEELMRRRLFAPLGILRPGFGGLGTPGEFDQPWPHDDRGNAMPSNGADVDNPPVLGPAGTVHLSLEDWAKFIQEHLAGRAGRGKLLGAEAYAHLHTSPDGRQSYAYGWNAVQRRWGGNVLSHSGSNTMNHSVAWLAPEKGFAVIACTNSGAPAAAKALDEAARLLIQDYLQA